MHHLRFVCLSGMRRRIDSILSPGYKKFLAIFLFLAEFNSLTCTCFGPESKVQDFELSSVVVTGSIISQELVIVKDTMHQYNVALGFVKGDPRNQDSVKLFRTTLKVEKILKGKNVSNEIIIYSGFGDIDCGFNFEIGKKYIVFGHRNHYLELSNRNKDYNTKVSTSQCGFTSEIEEKTTKNLKDLKRNYSKKLSSSDTSSSHQLGFRIIHKNSLMEFHIHREFWKRCETGEGFCPTLTFKRKKYFDNIWLIMPCGGTITEVQLHNKSQDPFKEKPIMKISIQHNECPPKFNLTGLPDGEYIASMFACGLGGGISFRIVTEE